jgi:hypothetical protein
MRLATVASKCSFLPEDRPIVRIGHRTARIGLPTARRIGRHIGRIVRRTGRLMGRLGPASTITAEFRLPGS